MKDIPAEKLLPSWFEGTLSPEERKKVEQWKNASEKNQHFYDASLKAWERTEQLKRMKKYDPGKALQQVYRKIEKQKHIALWEVFQKAAAILILPFIIATLYFSLNQSNKTEAIVPWQTLEIPAGMRSEFYLPDSTKVYMNSKTTLRYPLEFNNDMREVKLSGEAYFEVAENVEVPFIVNTDRINIEVTGTEFLATNYPHEELTEVVLVKGSVMLFQGDYTSAKKPITGLLPGERAMYRNDNTDLVITPVNAEKYLAWKKGILMFRDDAMPEVIRRLNRWYNVDIRLEGPELKDYTYTATFEDETLNQVLELMKISAPIDYTINERKGKNDKSFSKMEIIICKKKR